MACSRVRSQTDLLFNPPFRLANRHRLQERLHEDARLLRMSDGSPSPPPISGKLPPPQVRAEGFPLRYHNQTIIPSQSLANCHILKSELRVTSHFLMTCLQRVTNTVLLQTHLPPLLFPRDHRGTDDCSGCKYHPVDEVWQRFTCDTLGLQYVRPNGVSPGGPQIPLTRPRRCR